MINLNKHRIDFGKGDVGIGVMGVSQSLCKPPN